MGGGTKTDNNKKKKVGTRKMIIIDEQTSRIIDVKKRGNPHRIYMAKRF